MKKSLLLLILLLPCIQLYAQWDFRTGYIIKNSRDSIPGFIRYEEGASSTFCVFRSSEKSETQRFTPDELLEYGIIGDYRYVSASINDEGRKRVFLRQILAGRASLLQFGSRFYLMKDGLFSLSPRKADDNYYLKVLNSFLGECNLSADQINYDGDALANVLRNYNNCKGGGSTRFKMRLEKVKIGFELLAGYDSYKISTPGNAFELANGTTLSAGVGMNVFLPRLAPGVALSLHVLSAKRTFQFSGSYTRRYTTFYEDHFVTANTLRFPLGIKYHFLNNSIGPYAQATIVQNFILSSKDEVVQDVVVSKTVTSNEMNLKLQGKSPLGYSLGVGYAAKVFWGYTGFIEVRWEDTGHGILPESEIQLNAKSILFLAGIRF